MVAKKATPKAAAHPDPDELCLECYPGGWEALHPQAYTTGCQHGTYVHHERMAAVLAGEPAPSIADADGTDEDVDDDGVEQPVVQF